jgi:hypothetical protein
MGKKCIPGLFCIENMTLFLMLFTSFMIVYLWFIYVSKPNSSQIIVVSPPPIQYPAYLGSSYMSNSNSNLNLPNQDTLRDPYVPPTKPNSYIDQNSEKVQAYRMPINIETQGRRNVEYAQVGILTQSPHEKRHNHDESSNQLILPLMGRRHLSGRDKWNYYAISNTGSLNTKLPIRVNGRSCTTEYGCDPLNSGDSVYVEGYGTVFKATIYENNMFNYLPF